MKRAIAAVTSKGQVTIPVDVRRHLGVGDKDKVEFVIDDDGEVRVERVKYPTIASLAGAAGSLPRPMTWEEIEETVRDDTAERYREKFLRDE